MARVVGVDGSTAMLDLARTAAPNILFVEHGLVTGLLALDRQFDHVVAHMVLMHLPDIGAVLASTHPALKTYGTFVFTMRHPCFFQKPAKPDEEMGRLYRMVTGYLEAEVWPFYTFGGHNHYHRSLTYCADELLKHGFVM